MKGTEQPTQCGYLRRDFVDNDGQRLTGFIQVRLKRGKLTAVTVFGKQRKIGIQLNWLAKKNGVSA